MRTRAGGIERRSRATDSAHKRKVMGDVCEHGYPLRRFTEKIREAIPLAGYAAGLTKLRRRGGTLVGRCPLLDHEDRTPSFTVWVGSDSWWCFGCDRGSDVIDLYYHLHGCSEAWEALVGLGLEHGVEPPGRSEAWHRATQRKAEYRDAAYRVLGNVLKRRLYKTLVLPYIDLIEDPEEHERELERSWQEWAGWWRWPRLAEDLIAGKEDASVAIAGAKAGADRAIGEVAR